MQDILLDYGDTKMRVELPDTTTVVRFGKTYTDPPKCDPVEATRAALANPGDLPRLKDQAGPDKKIAIAFPDRVKGGSHALAHRKVSDPAGHRGTARGRREDREHHPDLRHRPSPHEHGRGMA